MSEVGPKPHKPKPRWLGAMFVVIGLAILIALGVWQLQRLKWKEALLAHVAALQHARPVPLGARDQDPPDRLDYMRVSIDCPGLERTPTLRLYAVGDDGQAGDRLITVCAADSSHSILVDRGFIAPDQAVAPGRERLDGPIVGVLRRPPGRNFVTPENDPVKNVWYWRDLPAMASALHANEPVGVMLMLESPAPVGGGPTPAAIPTEIPNRHLEYAITWFGLAAALVGVYAATLLRKRPV